MTRFVAGTPGFRNRRMAQDPSKLRASWIAAPGLARALASAAATEAADWADFRRGLTNLSLTLRDLAADNFPVAAPSARIMAAAFLALARNFAHPAWPPEARTACAPFLAAGAECVDQLLSNMRSREAVSGRRVLGEREDEA